MVDAPSTPVPVTAFDAHHPPSNEIIDKCVHCGFCLPVCPTYVLWGQEMDSPRGRIYLMKLAAEGVATMTPQWVQHFDTCLGCMACMTACPSGVDYGKLIEATRSQIERNHPRSPFEKLYRRFLFAIFTRPDRLHLLRLPILAYQKSGLQSLVRSSGLLSLFPMQVQTMEALLPKLQASEHVPGLTAANGVKRRRVGLLLGCVQREFFPQINAATARVLAAEGCEVVAPQAQPCCGALMVHAGEEEGALALARKTIEAFERAAPRAQKFFPPNARTSPKFSPNSNRAPSGTRFACASHSRIPAIFSTLKASAPSLARCSQTFPAWNLPRSRKARSAAALPESTIWSNRMPLALWANAKLASSLL